MEKLDELRRRLDTLRPLTPAQVELLFPLWRKEDALYVYATNAIEGSTLTLGETVAVLEQGLTIGQKTVREHLEAIDGQKAYVQMLDLARQNQPIDLEAILGLHRAVVGSVPYAGQWRDHAVYIRGSLHVPPNYVTLPQRLEEMMQTYGDRRAHGHAVEAAATLHFELLTIHPFADGNGRTARLVANLALIQAGYAPILIGPADKPRYFDVLQAAQIAVPGRGDATSFVALMAEYEALALERYLRALDIAHGSG